MAAKEVESTHCCQGVPDKCVAAKEIESTHLHWAVPDKCVAAKRRQCRVEGLIRPPGLIRQGQDRGAGEVELARRPPYVHFSQCRSAITIHVVLWCNWIKTPPTPLHFGCYFSVSASGWLFYTKLNDFKSFLWWRICSVFIRWCSEKEVTREMSNKCNNPPASVTGVKTKRQKLRFYLRRT